MAPLTDSVKVTLSYPLYACDFDPLDQSRLLVGGGGGAGRSGVGNKITLFDTSNPKELAEISDIDLSKDEDNVTSLAVAQPANGEEIIVFAGVNSSPSEVAAGRNAHLRAFAVEEVGSPSSKGKKSKKGASLSPQINESARYSFFSEIEKDAYQRLVCLSKPYPNQAQVGAVATGLAKSSEIVVFSTTPAGVPQSKSKIALEKEAVDMDILQTGNDAFSLAYCDNHDVYIKKISAGDFSAEPECVYITPASRSGEAPTIPAFRALRWLTKDYILMLTNVHSNGGVVLQVLQVHSTGKKCRIAESHRLASGLNKATGLAVANLTPPASASESQGFTQFVIAVAGHDRSIQLLKLDHQIKGVATGLSSIKPFRTFKIAHPLQITGLAFSNFTAPSPPITTNTPPQTLKLASVSVANTVLVHTLPLFPVPLSVKRGQSTTPRYVVALPSKGTKVALSILPIILVVILAIVAQGVLELRGDRPTLLGAVDIIPHKWQGYIVDHQPDAPKVKPQTRHRTVPQEPTAKPPTKPVSTLPKLLEAMRASDAYKGVIVIHEGTNNEDGTAEGIKATLHQPDLDPDHGGTKWEHLSDSQRKAWITRLTDLGHWSEGMGETILKGVVFGQVAQIVGQAVAG